MSHYLPHLSESLKMATSNVRSCPSPPPSSLSQASDYVPAHEYILRRPSPPRLAIPPPTLDYSNGYPEIKITQPGSHDFEISDFAYPGFLNTVTYGNFTTTHKMLDWSYEQRRKAQMILPFLFLGPSIAAKDHEFIRREGITLLLAIRDTKSAKARLLSGAKVAGGLGIAADDVDVAGNQELIAALPRAIRGINNHLAEVHSRHLSTSTQSDASNETEFMGKVLVFCESGNERSAGVVAAYLMAMYNMTVVQAIQLVQSQRFCISMEDSMKLILQNFEAILEAKRDVTRSKRNVETASHSVPASSSTPEWIGGLGADRRGKRTIDDAYDSDTEMGEGYEQLDYGRFVERWGRAPFEDKDGRRFTS